MWGDKEKPESLMLGSHLHGLGMRQLRPGLLQGLHQHIPGPHGGPRPTVLWKGETARKKRFEPFCSPMVPHVPIRQRLSSRRGTSVDVSEDAAMAASFYAQPRRRRMSLLQTLRQQNRPLNDSGVDMHRARTDSECTQRDTTSPPTRTPPLSPSKKAFSSIKSKIFGKREKRSDSAQYVSNGDYSQSCDLINGRSRKSPSTTNDSGRGSQGQLELRLENMAIVERPDNRSRKPQRIASCPDLLGHLQNSPPIVPLADSESDDDTAESIRHHLTRRNLHAAIVHQQPTLAM